LAPRPFLVKPYPECPAFQDAEERLPPHRLVVEPLVEVAVEIRVHPANKCELPMPPHTRRGRSLWLDPSAEIVKGWELFWNSGGWKRGAITLKVPVNEVDWDGVFSWTEYGGVWSSRHQILKGSPSAAVSYADRNGTGDHVVGCFSASNGIEWLDVWAEPKMACQLDATAKTMCRHFVRHIEQGKHDQEIIYDRAPYANML